MNILLTNDDGIEEAGLRALYTTLSEVGDVTAVAPAEDKSAVGRAMSSRVAVEKHELGYAVDGTPADCVVAGLCTLAPETDLVVSGCNRGANLGEYVLGRSGTVSAAVETTFFETPAIAVSMYITSDVEFQSFDPGTEEYDEAARAARYLAENTINSGVFERADYLNVNAPMAGTADDPEMEITEPSSVYAMDAVVDEDHVVLHDRIFEQMEDGTPPDPQGTDRRAVMEERVSVSALTAPHTMNHHEKLDTLADQY
jgi:5'-nucleotidase